MSFKYKLSVKVLCLRKIENTLNFTGIILERIQVLILLPVENDRSAVEVVAGITRVYTCELSMKKVNVVFLEVLESQTKSYQNNLLSFCRK